MNLRVEDNNMRNCLKIITKLMISLTDHKRRSFDLGKGEKSLRNKSSNKSTVPDDRISNGLPH